MGTKNSNHLRRARRNHCTKFRIQNENKQKHQHYWASHSFEVQLYNSFRLGTTKIVTSNFAFVEILFIDYVTQCLHQHQLPASFITSSRRKNRKSSHPIKFGWVERVEEVNQRARAQKNEGERGERNSIFALSLFVGRMLLLFDKYLHSPTQRK